MLEGIVRETGTENTLSPFEEALLGDKTFNKNVRKIVSALKAGREDSTEVLAEKYIDVDDPEVHEWLRRFVLIRNLSNAIRGVAEQELGCSFRGYQDILSDYIEGKSGAQFSKKLEDQEQIPGKLGRNPRKAYNTHLTNLEYCAQCIERIRLAEEFWLEGLHVEPQIQSFPEDLQLMLQRTGMLQCDLSDR